MNVSLIEEKKKTNQKMKFQTEYFSNYDRYLQYVGRISYADLLARKALFHLYVVKQLDSRHL